MDPVASTPRGGSAPLSAFIRGRKGDVLAEWSRAVRKLPVAARLDTPALMDHMPLLLDRIADLVCALEEGGSTELPREDAEQHAVGRLEEGFDLGEVVGEYSILRDRLLDLWARESAAGLVGSAVRIMNQAIDRAVSASIEQFVEARERTMAALDRVSSAALEAHSLQELLERLLRVVLETIPACDTALVLLREGDRLRARAAIGIEDEVDHGWSLAVGEGFAGTIAKEGRPRAVRDASHDPLVKSPFIRGKGVRALYGVPLVDGGSVIGVAHMGSLTAQDFSSQDKALLRSMAGRAAAVIAQRELRDELAQARTHAERSLAQLQAVLGAAPAGIALLDEDLKYVTVNQAMADMNGRSVEEHTGRALAEVLPTDVLAAVEPVVRGVLESRQPVDNVEVRRALPGGGCRCSLASYYPARLFGTDTFGVGVAVVDITDRKLAEEVLAAERKRYADLVDNLDHAVVWEADAASLRFSFVSARAQVISGYSAEDWMRDPDFWAKHVPEEDRGRVTALFERCRTQEADDRLEHGLRTRDGRVIWLQTGVHVTRQSGALVFQGVSIDVTALREAVRGRDEVLSIVSHDLRNPLQTISVNTRMLAQALPPDPQSARARRSADLILRATQAMTFMIDDLVDVAGIEQGRLAVGRSPEDPGELIAEAAETVEAVAQERRVQIQTDVAPGLPPAMCDRNRVIQVLWNILGNALNVTAPGGRITLRVDLVPGAVRFSVSDTGPGISDRDLPHIFDRYYRGQAAGYKGTGLGLAIAKGLVRAQGGQIWAESRVGVGTTSYFTLLPATG